MQKNISVRIICLIVALVMLSGALAFAAITGSPYEVLRDSVLQALTFRNVTMEGVFRVELNGEIYEQIRIHTIVGDNSYLEWSFNEQGNPSYFLFANEYLRLDSFNSTEAPGGVEFHQVSLNRLQSSRWMIGSGIQIFTLEELNSLDMRFSLLVLDALIGDLRNNVNMSSADGVRTIRASLTEHQIPEFVRAGIDLMIEQYNQFRFHHWISSFDGNYVVDESIFINGDMVTVFTNRTPARRMTSEEKQMWDDITLREELFRRHLFHHVDEYGIGDNAHSDYIFGMSWPNDEDYPLINTGHNEFVSESTVPAIREHFEGIDNPLDMPLRNLTINHVHIEAIVDSNGNLLDIDLSAVITLTNILRDIDKINFSFTMQFTDIGTSNPTSPIPDLEQILTFDNMYARFGHSPFRVNFTTNPDGTINMDSINTNFPTVVVEDEEEVEDEKTAIDIDYELPVQND